MSVRIQTFCDLVGQLLTRIEIQLSSDKGSRYVAQLYEARCNSSWEEVPELARKVEKHAPSRRTLTLASRAGATIYRGKDGYKIADSQYGTALAASLEQEDLHRDILDGLVTRALLYYGTGQPELALRQIPETLHRSPAPNGSKSDNVWFAVCVMQGTLLRGLSLEALGNLIEAGNTYRSVIAYASRVVALRSKYQELCRWTEELLSHLCVFFAMDKPSKPLQLGEAMAAFHLLSRFLDDQAWRPLGTRGSFSGHPPRDVWRSFYEALSRIVADGLVYHPSPVQRDHDTQEHRGLLEEEDFIASRVQQRADLRRVEVNYESLLLNDVHFPKANETNGEVRTWVELVMSNFRTLCGATWTDAELGAGGKNGVGRNTLDILYRAATKTFHSTQILRHLFQTHCFLGEFDLAYKALDSYVEIITKGKARVERSGQAGLDLDDDETAIRLGAEAIRIACQYGPASFADKISTLADILQQWLAKISSNHMLNSDGDSDFRGKTNGQQSHDSPLSSEVMALAYRAIGLSQANFARKTYNPPVRVEMRAKAIQNLQQSVDLSTNDSACSESLYALALLFAESRDIPGAIHFVKRVLARPLNESSDAVAGSAAYNEEDDDPDGDDSFTRERKILPAWHLLILLLCAREDFDVASTSCDAAFQQFGDAVTLFGVGGDATMSKQSVQQYSKSQGLVDRMETFEKQMLLEIKITQVALLELAHGPENAVNACNQLLALYARLFGKVDFVTTKAPRFNSIQLSRTSGTFRPKPPRYKHSTTFIGGFMVKGLQPKGYTPLSFPTTASALASRPITQSGPDPKSLYDKRNTITSSEKLNHRFSTNEKHFVDYELRAGNSLRPSAFGSVRSQRSIAQELHNAQNIDEKVQPDNISESVTSSPVRSRSFEIPPRVDSLSTHTSGAQNGNYMAGQPLEAIPQYGELPGPEDKFANLPILYSSANDYPVPTPQFGKIQERRHKISILVGIWLFTAGIYSRASLYEEAKQSIDEAMKLVTVLEGEVSRKGASVRIFQDEGWGGGRSVESLWSDVYTEKGKLYQAQSRPHDALAEFEQALAYSPNHPRATVELSSILLDIYAQVIPSEKPDPAADLVKLAAVPAHLYARNPPVQESELEKAQTAAAAERMTQPLPPELYRLVARDRAYGLLSSLTKLEPGWDNSEAWFALARAFEESGQVEEAKKALWWTVELEDSKPVRPWVEVSPGGYVL